MQADNLQDHQQAITINMGDFLHVISIVTIRQLAAGCQYYGDHAKLVQILATALKDFIDGSS